MRWEAAAQVRRRAARRAARSNGYGGRVDLKQEVIVDRPIDEVAELLTDPATSRAWHRDLLSATVKRGTDGKPGAVTELVYSDKGRKFKVEEEIISLDLPAGAVTTYKGPGMKHRLTTSLRDLGDGKTQVTVENQIKLSGVAKLAGPVIGMGTRGQMETRARDLQRYLETGSID